MRFSVRLGHLDVGQQTSNAGKEFHPIARWVQSLPCGGRDEGSSQVYMGVCPRRYCEDMDVRCNQGKPDREEILQEVFMSRRMALLANVLRDE